MSAPLSRQRSLSYNDLKKRRCLRESLSRQKLKGSVEQSAYSTSNEKCEAPNLWTPFLQMGFDESLLNSLKRNRGSQQVRHNKVYGPMDHFSNHTIEEIRRNQPLKNKLLKMNKATNHPDPNQNVVKPSFIVHQLIQRQKSDKKVLTLRDLRSKFKQSKELSRSRSKQTSKQSIKMIENAGSARVTRLRKFQVIDEIAQRLSASKSRSKRKLIELRKELSRSNKQDQLGTRDPACQRDCQRPIVEGFRESQPGTPPEQQNQKNSSNQQDYDNILDLLEFEEKGDIRKALSRKSKEKQHSRILNGFNKKFNKDFYDV